MRLNQSNYKSGTITSTVVLSTLGTTLLLVSPKKPDDDMTSLCETSAIVYIAHALRLAAAYFHFVLKYEEEES